MKSRTLIIALGCASVTSAVVPAQCAENLRLAPGISFTSDTGTVFPITGNRLDDASIEKGRPTVIFFGAAGDMNTNRQAKRFVNLYRKERDRGIKFVVIDVDRPGNDVQRQIIQRYYQGYIPAQAMLDRDGKLIWNQVGELSRHHLRARIGGAM